MTFAVGGAITVREVLLGQTWAAGPRRWSLIFPNHPWPHPWGT